MVEVRKHFFEISRWVESINEVEAFLNHGENTILSSCGLHQGDPLAPLLFSVTLHTLVLKLAREAPSLTENAWFLDYGLISGNIPALQAVVDILKQEGPLKGLFLSSTKSKVWSPSQLNTNDPLSRGIPLDTSDGINLLGAPVGSERFESEMVEERITKSECLMEKLSFLEDPHTEYNLSGNCFAMQKLSYTLRTVDPRLHKDLMLRYDHSIRNSLE